MRLYRIAHHDYILNLGVLVPGLVPCWTARSLRRAYGMEPDLSS